MLKRILAARKHVAIGLAVGLAALATGAFADAATGRVRHMADTYLQSDGTQIIDTGFIATTNMRVEVVFEPINPDFTKYTRYVWGSNASVSNGAAQMRFSTYGQNNDAAKRYGMAGNYVAGANLAGFEKVLDAMNAQGIV